MTEPERIQEKVFNEVDRMKDEIVHTIQELVRMPSVVGDEAKAQEYMETLYRSLDLEVTRFQADIEKVKQHPAFIDTKMPYDNRPNVIGTILGAPNSQSLILNGHIDVVSPEPISEWSHNPWGAEIEGDRMYGRGAGDMKAGLLANFFALKAIKKSGLRPRGTVNLHSVIDEEAGGAGGTLACLMEGYTADAMICTEQHLNVTIACAGICYFRIKVHGKTSHAGMAHLGVNAIGKMLPVYQAFQELDEKRGREVHFPLFEKDSERSCNINIGVMNAGDWPSTVAGYAQIEGRFGFIPGEGLEDIRGVIKRTVERVAQKDPWLRDHPPEIEWFGWQTEPWYQDPENTYVKALKRSLEKVLGHHVSYRGSTGGLDARFAPYFNMAAASAGPYAGNIHGIDEFVDIPSVILVTKALSMLVLDWCGYEA